MSKYDLKDAVIHIVHDYGSLVMAGKDTQRTLKYPLNHYAERTFLTHCRTLAEFFSLKNKNKGKLHASDFTDSTFSAELPTWKKWRRHINTHLMHLTVARIENKTPWDGKPNKEILKEFETAWDKFMDELKPDLKPLFEKELKKY